MTDKQQAREVELALAGANHVWYKCGCESYACQFCDGGLASCTVCKCIEGSLATECPGFDCYLTHGEDIYQRKIDFKDGQWVSMIEAVIYTDGSCLKNPGGAGGYAAIVVKGDLETVVTGGEPSTTNNRMEILAAISGLKHLGEARTRVQVVTDSEYVLNSIVKGWARGWAKKRWVRQGKPVPNSDLWIRLLALCDQHDIAWTWVRGHNGHGYNERCDELALAAAKLQRCDEWYTRTDMSALCKDCLDLLARDRRRQTASRQSCDTGR